MGKRLDWLAITDFEGGRRQGCGQPIKAGKGKKIHF